MMSIEQEEVKGLDERDWKGRTLYPVCVAEALSGRASRFG